LSGTKLNTESIMANYSGFTYEDEDVEETEIWDYLGDNIYHDSLVVYIPKQAFFGKHRKNIWIVKNLNNTAVRLENIANGDSFTTTIDKILSVEILDSWGYINSKYISNASLSAYNTYVKEEFNDEWNVTVETHKVNQTERKENIMNKITLNGTVQRNTSAAKDAALIVAGGTLNAIIADKVKGQLPRKYRKLAEHPLADVVIANIASFAVQNFANTNYKARVAADAMMNAAMVEFMQSFNIEKMIAEVLSNVDISDLIDAAE